MFYDKEISLHTVTTNTDDEGFVYTSLIPSDVSFMGNVRYDKLDHVKEDYGIKEDIDCVISTHQDVNNGDVLEYAGNYFVVIRSIVFDSHNLLIAKKWQNSQLVLSV